MNFGMTGETYTGADPLIGMAFNMMSAGIVRSIERYEKRCRANEENIKKRWQKTDTNEYDGIPTDTNEYEQRGTGTGTVVGTGAGTGNDTDNVVFVSKGPALEEVEEFCKQQQLSFDPQKFFSYYETVGWIVKGQPMRDWKAAARVWNSNEQKKGDLKHDLGGKQGVDLAGDGGIRVRTEKDLYDVVSF